MAAGGDPGARPTAGPARFAAVALLDGGGGLRRTAGGAGLPGVPRRRLGRCTGGGARAARRRVLAELAGAAAVRRAARGAADRADARVPADRGRLARRAARPHAARAVATSTRSCAARACSPSCSAGRSRLAAVAGAIGWRRRIAGTGPLLVAAAVWARAQPRHAARRRCSPWLPGLDRVNVPRYGEFVLGLAAAALAAAALAADPAAGGWPWAPSPRSCWRRSGCCTRRGSSPCRSIPFRPLPSLAAVRARSASPGQRLAAIGRNVRPQIRRRSRSPTRGPRTRSTRSATRGSWRCAAAAPGSGSCSRQTLRPPASTSSTPSACATSRRRPARRRRPACSACRRGPMTSRCSPTPRRTRTRSRPPAVAFAASEDEAARALGRAGRLRDRSVIERPTAAMRAATGTATATVDGDRLGSRAAAGHEQTGAALLVVASQVFPGWDGDDRRRGDADPARQPRDARRSRCPDGSHAVEFRYRPASFRLGLLLAMVGGLALARGLCGLPAPSYTRRGEAQIRRGVRRPCLTRRRRHGSDRGARASPGRAAGHHRRSRIAAFRAEHIALEPALARRRWAPCSCVNGRATTAGSGCS